MLSRNIRHKSYKLIIPSLTSVFLSGRQSVKPKIFYLMAHVRLSNIAINYIASLLCWLMWVFLWNYFLTTDILVDVKVLKLFTQCIKGAPSKWINHNIKLRFNRKISLFSMVSWYCGAATKRSSRGDKSLWAKRQNDICLWPAGRRAAWYEFRFSQSPRPTETKWTRCISLWVARRVCFCPSIYLISLRKISVFESLWLVAKRTSILCHFISCVILEAPMLYDWLDFNWKENVNVIIR